MSRRPFPEHPSELVISQPEKLLRPTWAEISCAALRRNSALVRALAGRRRVMAVIKADAYGHGAVPVARVLEAAGSDAFGVATIEEGIELREAGITKPILLLGGIYMSDPAALVEYRLAPTISSTARLDTIAECARRQRTPVEFHLKIDTGMSRLGLPPKLLQSFVEHWRSLDGGTGEVLRLGGCFTHLASAEDCVATQTDEQLSRFKSALRRLRGLGASPGLVHISNSAGLVARSNIPETMVRVGALFFGFCLPLVLPAGANSPPALQLEPALTFKSRVIFLKDHPAGTPLGYSGSFFTRRPSRIATLPVGYADGLNRALSNRGEVVVRGRRARIVGNISMDLTLVDVTDIPGVSVGDEVTLMGGASDDAISAASVAKLLGTIPYEVLCSVGKRVPRIYVEAS